jgi:hypothetical protein
MFNFGKGKETAEVARGLIEGVGNTTEKIVNVIRGVNPEADKLLLELAAQINKGSQEITKIEAGSSRFFVAGWRPFIGWICGISLALYYIPQFVLMTFFWAKLTIETGIIQPYPGSITDIIGLIASLGGFSILRTLEKNKGSQANH